MNKFDSINIGDKAELTHQITEADIENFVKLTGDDNKLHTDKNFASRTPYKKTVAHGMLGASFISTVIGTKLPGDGAMWFAQNLEFLLPVRVGDQITVTAEVIKKVARGQIIEMKTDIFNQNNQKVTGGYAKIKVFQVEKSIDDCERTNIEKPVALVIGATGGIGKATCLQLAKDGFNLAIHYYKNKDIANEISAEVNALGRKSIVVKADIRYVEQVEELVIKTVRSLDTITVLANCSTASVPAIKLSNLEWDIMELHFDINVKGAFNIQKFVVPIMKLNKYGKIINITTQAIEKPNSGWLHYITAKSALHGFSKALAFELAPNGITVNLVSPGMTDTDLIADISEETRLITAAQTPMRRIAKAEDIAAAISFLASKKADFITGETIRVNGGQIMI